MRSKMRGYQTAFFHAKSKLCYRSAVAAYGSIQNQLYRVTELKALIEKAFASGHAPGADSPYVPSSIGSHPPSSSKCPE